MAGAATALVGSNLKSIAKDVARYGEEVRGLQMGKGYSEFTAIHSRKDMVPLRCLVSLSTVEYAGKTAALSFNRDVTRQVEMEEALRRRDAILEAVSFAAEKLLSGGEWEESIASVLERLGLSMSVSRAYIFENNPGHDGDLLTSQRYRVGSLGDHAANGQSPTPEFLLEKASTGTMDGRPQARGNWPGSGVPIFRTGPAAFGKPGYQVADRCAHLCG